MKFLWKHLKYTLSWALRGTCTICAQPGFFWDKVPHPEEKTSKRKWCQRFIPFTHITVLAFPYTQQKFQLMLRDSQCKIYIWNQTKIYYCCYQAEPQLIYTPYRNFRDHIFFKLLQQLIQNPNLLSLYKSHFARSRLAIYILNY